MARKAPEPNGYYRYKDKDYLAIDPLTLSDTGEILVKDADSGNWKDAVAFRRAEPGSPLLIRETGDFMAKFKPTTREDCFSRTQEAEAAESARLAAEAEGSTGEDDGA